VPLFTSGGLGLGFGLKNLALFTSLTLHSSHHAINSFKSACRNNNMCTLYDFHNK